MKAIIQERYGPPDVLDFREVDTPVPGPGEVLVRVRAASVHADVWHVMRGVPYVLRLMGAGLRRPKNPIPGTDVAGQVESAGPNVTRFQPGDEVFGECVRGHQWHNGGAYAEYVCVAEDALARKPAGITFEQAAAVPTSAFIALQAVRDQAGVQPGQQVVINGAGGGVGSFAVQLAKASGARVIGVDSTDKLDMLTAIGADQVIDYTAVDFTQTGERYDVIVDIPGGRPWSAYRRALTPAGTYVLIGHDHFGGTGHRWIGTLGTFAKLLALSTFVKQLRGVRVPSRTPDPLGVIADLVAAGKITPVVDRTFPLRQVPDAIRYLEGGRARGKVVITV